MREHIAKLTPLAPDADHTGYLRDDTANTTVLTGGNDILDGGAGDDTYVLGDAGDQVNEACGFKAANDNDDQPLLERIAA